MTLTYIKAVRIFLLAASSLVWPVAAQEKYDEAQDFYKHENYGSALPLLEEQLKKSPDNALLNYQAGVCYLHSRSLKARAVEYLEKAVEHSPYLRTKSNPGPAEAPADAYKMLGDAYCYAYKFEPAIKSYEQFKSFDKEKDLKSPLIPEVDHKIEICRHMKDYRPAQSIPLGAKSGSPCGEMAKGIVTSTLSPDKNTMIYTLKIPVDQLKSQDESSRYFEEITLPPSKDSTTSKKSLKNPVKELIERDTVVYASTIGTSHDGQIMLTYKNENGNGSVYISRLRDNRWSAPSPLKKCANAAGWEPYESVSADGNYLYFASNRDGGYGGWDLYRCKKQPDGQWSKAINLGPSINTEADELAPFIYADGLTIFFSSNRVKRASYDIFTSTATSVSVASIWGAAVNVGYPINRNANDIFQVTADNKVFGSVPGGAASFNKKDTVIVKTESTAKKTFRPDRDNYLITFTGQQKLPLNMRRGTVTDEKGESPVGGEITVFDNLTGETQGDYYTSDNTGEFGFVLPAGRNLQVLYQAQGYLPQSENINLANDKNYFEEYKSVKLYPLKSGATATLNNVFFEENKTTIDKISNIELKRVASMLRENPGMKVDFENMIITRNDARFHKSLSKARAKELCQYFVKEGISKKRIDGSGSRQNPPKVKEVKPEKGKPKSRKPAEPKVEKPVQVVVMKVTEIKNEN